MFNWLFKKVVTFREKVAVDLGEGDTEKPFLEHLDDLRTMIVRIVVTLLVCTIGTFVFIEELMRIITYPLVMAGIADHVTLQNLKPTGGFMTAMNISLVAGVIISFPALLYFLLQFVLPGLRSNEKKVLFPALAVGAGLFLTGVVFAYYVVAPRALEFFYQFSRDIGSTAHVQVETKLPSTPDPKAPEAKAPDATAPQAPAGASELKPGTRITATTEGGKVLVFEVVEVRPGAAATGPPPGPVKTELPPNPAKTGEGDASATTTTALSTTPDGEKVAATAPMLWELTEYVKFLCQFILIFGACFELPVVVMALVKLDVLNYKVMKTSRSWAAIIICVVAAVITPTQDALTLGLLAVPMYVLYEVCIWLAWWMEKRDRKLYPEYYKERDEDEKELAVSDDWDNENYNPWGGNDDEEDDDDERARKSKPAPAPSPEASDSGSTGTISPTTETPETSKEGPDSEYAAGSGISDSDSGTDADSSSQAEKSGATSDDGSEKSDSSSKDAAKPDEPSADKRDTD